MSSPSYTLINQTAHDPYTPSDPVCRTSTIGELSHTWSKLFLMSHQESLSNDSISTAGATTRIRLFIQDKAPYTTLQTYRGAKVSPFLFASLVTLFRSQHPVSETNLCLLYAPVPVPPTTTIKSQLPYRNRKQVFPTVALSRAASHPPCLRLSVLPRIVPSVWPRMAHQVPSMVPPSRLS